MERGHARAVRQGKGADRNGHDKQLRTSKDLEGNPYEQLSAEQIQEEKLHHIHQKVDGAT